VPLITVRGLTKEYVRTKPVDGRFGAMRTLFTREKVRTLAVDHIDFAVEKGEVVGYLDVLAKEAVRGFVEEANRQGRTTVLLTTHDLADVERLGRRILLIDHGQVLYDGPVDGLKAT
jgi:ABC-type uncharacterized transport system ATPase subunit